MKKVHEIDDKLLEKIISVAYGDAKLFDKIKINRLVQNDENIKNILNEFRETANQLASIKDENCPDEVLIKVYSEIGIEEDKISLIEKIQFYIFSRPVYTAAVVLFLMFTTLFIIFNKPETQPQYTKAEVKTAELQVKQTLVFINKIFERTSKNLEENILPNEVGKPIRKGLNVVTNILNGG